MSEESHAELQIDGPPRFQFVRALGRGVLGEAHEVIDEVRGEHVVLKIFLRCRPQNTDTFKLDFEALARLQHPALVRFHHLVDPASDTNVDIENRLGAAGLAFTQEYVDGVDLLSWLNRPATSEDVVTMESRRTPTTGEMPVPDELSISEASDVETGSGELNTNEVAEPMDIASSIIDELAASSEAVQKPPLDLVLLRLERVVPQIVDALTYLHRFHKVHGFLRPANILVTRLGECKLTDYGIIPNLVYRPREGAQRGEPVSLLCAPEHVPYVAPELDGVATAAGDRYALGTVLFEAVAGYPPADAMVFVGGRGRGLEVPPLAELVPECPAVWAERIDALLRADPEARPSLAAIGQVMGEGRAVKLPPTVIPEPEGFVGQRRLLAALRSEAHDVAEGDAMRFVLLEGEAGVGKSLVTDEFAHWLSRRGWLVISGRCFNRESAPLQGWHEIARRLAVVIDGLPHDLQEAIAPDRALAAVLFDVLLPDAVPSKAVGRLAAIRALQRLLGFLSEQRPILLLIEDLHWASWDTAALLMDLFSKTAAVRCMIVGTWRTDSPRSDDHFLTRDLDVSLVEVRRLVVSGFTRDEAREFLIMHAPEAQLDDLQRILRAGRSNPRILRELIWELEAGRLTKHALGKKIRPELLSDLIRARTDEFDKRHTAMISLLAAASGPLTHAWLCRAVEAELSGSVLPAQQTTESMEEAFALVEERRLVRRGGNAVGDVEWVIAGDVCRDVALEHLSERDVARLCGRIADTIPDGHADCEDLRFEYELRAARVAKALKAAVRVARSAETRFAYHRAAKLWRWLLEHAEKLDDPTVRPGAELARVEHLAGQHAEAAELYQTWATQTADRLRRAKIRADEAAAWLQAGDSDSAVVALDLAFRDFGQTYVSKWHAAVSETPRRLVATLVRWNEKLAEKVRPGAAEKGENILAGLYDFALEYNAWLDSSRAPEIEARLARLASGADDALILGLHRVRVAMIHAGDGVQSKRDRAFGWLDEAERIIATLEDPRRLAQVKLNRAILQIRYGDFGPARESLDQLAALNAQAEGEHGTDLRWPIYWRAELELRGGDLSTSEGLTRQLLHTYRGDRLAASRAYSLLTQIALLRGQAELAAVFLDAGRSAVNSTTPTAANANWFVPQAQLHIALGRPEVAVGQLQVHAEALAGTPFATQAHFSVPLQLGLGQAAAALAERQRVLAEPRQDATRALLRTVRRRLEPHLTELAGRRRAEVLRLLARIAVVAGKPKKALKLADAAIEALGSVQAPIDVGLCTEARGTVLSRLERPEARGIIEQAWELYRHCDVSFPLVLEGWPVPREGAMLKED